MIALTQETTEALQEIRGVFKVSTHNIIYHRMFESLMIAHGGNSKPVHEILVYIDTYLDNIHF